VLLPGQRFETVGVPPLIEGVTFEALIADKAFDSNAIVADLDQRGDKIVISQHPRRAKPSPSTPRCTNGVTSSRTFSASSRSSNAAMRADKTDQSFAAIIHLAAAVIVSR
jgi:hypothetical protein